MERLDKDQAKRNYLKNMTEEEKLLFDKVTFSPYINESSQNLERTVEDLNIWNEKRKFKLELKKLNENVLTDRYNHTPSIVSGPKTRPRYLDFLEQCNECKKIEDSKISEKQYKNLRAAMTPEVNSKSRAQADQLLKEINEINEINESNPSLDNNIMPLRRGNE